jgi:hypothetical protein
VWRASACNVVGSDRAIARSEPARGALGQLVTAARPKASERALGLVAALCAACSTSLGAAGSYSVHPEQVANLGFKTRSLVNLGLFDTKANLALGVESQVLQRLSGGNAWGQWRIQALAGITHMPNRHELRLGYEALLVAGLARYYAGEAPTVGAALGASFGAPIRLSSSAPPWRSDDLAAMGLFLVPEVGLTTLGLANSLEVTAGLSLRVHLWSAFMP